MRKWLYFLAGILFLLIVVLAAGSAYVWHEIAVPADSHNSQTATFQVKKGESVKTIAANLRQENFIKSEFWFETYVWYKKQGSNLQAGEYALSPDLSIPEILQIITGGRVVPNETSITFPEGFTVKQIEARLQDSGLASAAGLAGQKIDGFQVQYKFLSEVSPNASLEGFLFPDTYRFKKDVSQDEIIKKFLENFDRKLQPDWRAEIERQGKSIYQIVTMASIVQQEALNTDEMPTIAGIFWNRLSIGMPLQSDVTVNYATGKKLRQVTDADLKFDSPYNTYMYKGLPPAPIANPGVEAIKAAIYPKASDYLYFLHPLNSSAVYSKTLDEHNKNKAKYLK